MAHNYPQIFDHLRIFTAGQAGFRIRDDIDRIRIQPGLEITGSGYAQK